MSLLLENTLPVLKVVLIGAHVDTLVWVQVEAVSIIDALFPLSAVRFLFAALSGFVDAKTRGHIVLELAQVDCLFVLVWLHVKAIPVPLVLIKLSSVNFAKLYPNPKPFFFTLIEVALVSVPIRPLVQPLLVVLAIFEKAWVNVPSVFATNYHGYAFALFLVVIVSPSNIQLLSFKIH
jgi:hypothetical protein